MMPIARPGWLLCVLVVGVCVVGLCLVLFPEHYIKESVRYSRVPESVRFPLSVPVVRAIGGLMVLSGVLVLVLAILQG